MSSSRFIACAYCVASYFKTIFLLFMCLIIILKRFECFYKFYFAVTFRILFLLVVFSVLHVHLTCFLLSLIFPVCLVLLRIFVAYFCCLFLLLIFVAYFCCLFLLLIFVAYFCCLFGLLFLLPIFAALLVVHLTFFSPPFTHR